MVLNIHRNHAVWEVGGEGDYIYIIPIATLSPQERLLHQDGQSHFNISLLVAFIYIYIIHIALFPTLHCHHQNDSCTQIGSDESHFNVSFVVGCFYIALFSTLEQTHCTLDSKWIKVTFVTVHYSSEVMYLQRSLVVMWMAPRETAAISAQVLHTPYNRALCLITSCQATYGGCMPVLW